MKNKNLCSFLGIFLILGVLAFSLNSISARSCTYSYQCSNAGDPIVISSEKATQYECIDGQCVAEDFVIECEKDADCRDKYGGGNCDLTYDNFGNCINIPSAKCGDGTCQPSETKSGCPEDCDLDYKIRQIKNETSSTNTLIIVVGIIVILILLAIIFKNKK